VVHFVPLDLAQLVLPFTQLYSSPVAEDRGWKFPPAIFNEKP